ncbi:MAG: SDR family oxidoreductase [Candidatus Eisenbacteria bacterium]|nr:SDR family oxidoreductase [Candidatus Eisenbacteria bacterium]
MQIPEGLFLVTGGAGFIGSHIVERLLREGRRVRVIDNFSTGRRENLAPLLRAYPTTLELLEADIRDEAMVRRAMDGATHVVHQAALASVQRSVTDPKPTHDVNMTGTLLLLEAAREQKVRRFVFAGSSSVYGDQPELPKHEEMAPRPRSPYALSKLVGESYCQLFFELYGLETVTLRYFNVFGPRQTPDSQYAAVIPLFARAVVKGETPEIFGDGEQTRDFTFIENVVEANLLALTRPGVGGQVVNIGCGDRTSLLQLLRTIARLRGAEVAPSFQPPRAGDVRDSQASIEAARRLLGYEPKVNLEEGLRRTLAWFLEPSAA